MSNTTMCSLLQYMYLLNSSPPHGDNYINVLEYLREDMDVCNAK